MVGGVFHAGREDGEGAEGEDEPEPLFTRNDQDFYQGDIVRVQGGDVNSVERWTCLILKQDADFDGNNPDAQINIAWLFKRHEIEKEGKKALARLKKEGLEILNDDKELVMSFLVNPIPMESVEAHAKIVMTKRTPKKPEMYLQGEEQLVRFFYDDTKNAERILKLKDVKTSGTYTKAYGKSLRLAQKKYGYPYPLADEDEEMALQDETKTTKPKVSKQRKTSEETLAVRQDNVRKEQGGARDRAELRNLQEALKASSKHLQTGGLKLRTEMPEQYKQPKKRMARGDDSDEDRPLSMARSRSDDVDGVENAAEQAAGGDFDVDDGHGNGLIDEDSGSKTPDTQPDTDGDNLWGILSPALFSPKGDDAGAKLHGGLFEDDGANSASMEHIIPPDEDVDAPQVDDAEPVELEGLSESKLQGGLKAQEREKDGSARRPVGKSFAQSERSSKAKESSHKSKVSGRDSDVCSKEKGAESGTSLQQKKHVKGDTSDDHHKKKKTTGEKERREGGENGTKSSKYIHEAVHMPNPLKQLGDRILYGRRIECKERDGESGSWRGLLVGFDKTTDMYTVRYEDGYTEEFDADCIRAMLLPVKSEYVRPAIPLQPALAGPPRRREKSASKKRRRLQALDEGGAALPPGAGDDDDVLVLKVKKSKYREADTTNDSGRPKSTSEASTKKSTGDLDENASSGSKLVIPTVNKRKPMGINRSWYKAPDAAASALTPSEPVRSRDRDSDEYDAASIRVPRSANVNEIVVQSCPPRNLEEKMRKHMRKVASEEKFALDQGRLMQTNKGADANAGKQAESMQADWREAQFPPVLPAEEDIQACIDEVKSGGCSEALLEKIGTQVEKLKHALHPYHNTKHYSSYGRFFTNTSTLNVVINRMVAYMKPTDHVIDFSCGANEWCSLVKSKLKVDFISFDLFLPKDPTNWIGKNWFDVTADDIRNGFFDKCGKKWQAEDELVIGLNPPFGFENKQAKKFVQHAVEFLPRLLVLIIPNLERDGVPDKKKYRLVHRDDALTRNNIFYIPGCSGQSRTIGTHTTPELLIYERIVDQKGSFGGLPGTGIADSEAGTGQTRGSGKQGKDAGQKNKWLENDIMDSDARNSPVVVEWNNKFTGGPANYVGRKSPFQHQNSGEVSDALAASQCQQPNAGCQQQDSAGLNEVYQESSYWESVAMAEQAGKGQSYAGGAYEGVLNPSYRVGMDGSAMTSWSGSTMNASSAALQSTSDGLYQEALTSNNSLYQDAYPPKPTQRPPGASNFDKVPPYHDKLSGSGAGRSRERSLSPQRDFSSQSGGQDGRSSSDGWSWSRARTGESRTGDTRRGAFSNGAERGIIQRSRTGDTRRGAFSEGGSYTFSGGQDRHATGSRDDSRGGFGGWGSGSRRSDAADRRDDRRGYGR